MSDGMTEYMENLKKQVGGDHYKSMVIQPVQYIHHNGLGFLEGLVVKYVSRHRSKNGREDLCKAKHALDLLLTMEYDVKNRADTDWREYAERQGGQPKTDGDI
jgi:hypothetical protein